MRCARIRHESASEILHAHFPVTYHAEVLWATGIGSIQAESQDAYADQREVREEHAVCETTRHRKRDADFKVAVLRAYAERCAVCEFSVRLDGAVLVLEAAHIHWHCYAGPSVVRNGIALCALRHRLFDRGAFALDDSVHDTTPRPAERVVHKAGVMHKAERSHHAPEQRCPTTTSSPLDNARELSIIIPTYAQRSNSRTRAQRDQHA